MGSRLGSVKPGIIRNPGLMARMRDCLAVRPPTEPLEHGSTVTLCS